MPSILAANALTTLAAVNDELGLTSDSGGAQDQRVERYINEASDLIEQFVGRTLRRTDGIVENVRGLGTNVLRLARRPIVEITSIVVSGSTVDADDYFVEDAEQGKVYRATPWPWTAQRAPGITQGPIPGSEDRSQIVVTYDAGWVTPAQVADEDFVTRTLPFQIEGACIRMVASRWRGRGTDAAVEQESGQNSSRSFSGARLPPPIMAMLADYRVFPHA